MLADNRESSEYQTFLVQLPTGFWWAGIGIPANNPGTWDDCAIVADDGSQRLLFDSAEDFNDWNRAARRDPMQTTTRYGDRMYRTA